jgi:hypothetical protein
MDDEINRALTGPQELKNQRVGLGLLNVMERIDHRKSAGFLHMRFILEYQFRGLFRYTVTSRRYYGHGR